MNRDGFRKQYRCVLFEKRKIDIRIKSTKPSLPDIKRIAIISFSKHGINSN